MLDRPRYEYRLAAQKMVGSRIVATVKRFHSIVQVLNYIEDNKDLWQFDNILGGYTESFHVDDFKVLEEIDYTKVTIGQIIAIDFIAKVKVAA